MKAVILALETSDGLWPVPAGGSPAGAPLLDRPLLAWTAQALKRAGVSRLLLVLPEDAPVPDQSELPIEVRRMPPGTTAGAALAACADELSDGAFFAVDGGVLWEADLKEALRTHRRRSLPAARILLRPRMAPSRKEPAEDRVGRVVPFPQRPDIRRPEPIDAGLLVLSPSLLPCLKEAGEEDLPLAALLERRGVLDQVEAEGYCLRVDTPSQLLQASADLLSGKCRLHRADKPIRTGIWSRSPIPEGVELVPPCFIGSNVSLGKGCLIGPHAVLGSGTSVGDHSLVQRSVLQSDVAVGSRATVYGAVVCRGARLGCYAVLNEGAAVGPGAQVGDNVILMEGVGVGPELTVPPSVRLTDSLTESMRAPEPPAGPALTVEDMLRLGRRLGRCGTVGAGGSGFRGLLLARAFACGAGAAGAAVVFHDALTPEQAAWLARYYRWPASVFVDEDGGAYLYGQDGAPLDAPPPDGETGEGSWDLLAGTAAAYAAARTRSHEENEFPPACTAFRRKKGLDFL